MVVLGNNLRYLFEDYYPRERIYVVPNGGDYSFPKPSTNSEKVQLLGLSNLMAPKGTFDVLEALFKLKDIQHLFSCQLIGAWVTTEFQEKCLAYIKQNEVPVEIKPPIGGSPKFQALVDADVFVFPPNSPEGHPWAIVEAMAAGLPLVSTNQGAIVESVIHEENGFIVRSGSPEEIAGALRILITDAAKRKAMAQRSRELYEEKFTEATMVKNYTDVFNDIIAAQ